MACCLPPGRDHRLISGADSPAGTFVLLYVKRPFLYWREILIVEMTGFCYTFSRTCQNSKKKGDLMFIEIDFNSEEAFYIQLRNQIIIGIAAARISEGDPLPSVRQLANRIGINMHTVNKAYTILKQEGFVRLDRRGAVIALDMNKMQALTDMKEQLRIVLARGSCKNVTRAEIHELVDEILAEYQ